MTGIGRSWSVALAGTTGTMVEVEAAIGGGLPRTVLVGLPDSSLYEARDRCRAAVASMGRSWPSQLVTINLSPATLPKCGSHYDLSIVAAVWAASGEVPADVGQRTVMLGELGLDGRVRPVPGVLPALLAARQSGVGCAVVPHGQGREAAMVVGMAVQTVADLDQLRAHLVGEPVLADPEHRDEEKRSAAEVDLSEVEGQDGAKLAAEVAVAGGHHLHLHGPPGVGKTLIAERLPTLLPPLTEEEALEVAGVRSLIQAGAVTALPSRRPFSAPHHSASMAGMIGGGAKWARPGAVSAAHRGVLFLDEAPEFSPRVLDCLRTPLESGQVTIGRSAGTVTYPARFQLVLAANPCPCGYAGLTTGQCTCSALMIRRYAQRISGPILDRIDIHQVLEPQTRSFLASADAGDSSAVVADRVRVARERQAARLAQTVWHTNADVAGSYLRRQLPPPRGVETLDRRVRAGALSARGVDKVVRVSWTLADLAGRDVPSSQDLEQALAFRQSTSPGSAA